MNKYHKVFVSLNELELEELKQIKKDVDEFITAKIAEIIDMHYDGEL